MRQRADLGVLLILASPFAIGGGFFLGRLLDAHGYNFWLMLWP